MTESIPGPQLTPPIPVPDSDRLIIVPPEPFGPLEIEESPQPNPDFPIREPRVGPLPQVVKVDVI